MDWNKPDVWDMLRGEARPILLYGMGDGADKMLRAFAGKGIRAAGVFASDEFVRGHSFAGFPVLHLRDIMEQFGEDIVVVLAFASQRPELLARFSELRRRFPFFAPDVPVCGEGLFDRSYARAHRAELEAAYSLLADGQSRRVFRDTVAFKLFGDIGVLRRCESPKDEIFGLLAPGGGEDFADLGAYNGDTIRELLHHTGGRFSSITAFEPDRRNFKKLAAYAQEHLEGKGEIELVPAGAWSHDTQVRFSAKAGRNSRVSGEGRETPMRSLDSVLGGRRCSFLKLDVEGAERQALEGARATLTRFHPKINCAAYHRNEDLFALPLFLHENWPGCRLYLRHHPYVPAWDTNLYAVWDGGTP
ncbi:MAG: FkbM family methyltransferase [Clostridiaceae bacterium]|nr:FkbM family methyltransferase [Clostridiaceae bacterium]